jgi:glycerophosphoryl diester phosphodiesterase
MSRSRTVRALLAVATVALAGAAATATTERSDAASKPNLGATFDSQGHRGTRGLRPENTLAAFGKALQIGVTTLELDTGVSKDGVVVVSHERRASRLECQGAHIGQLWKDLTLAQIETLDCGTRNPPNPATDPFVATQEAVPGTRMPTLAEVFQLAQRYGADKVEFNVETKLDPTLPGETVDPATFARQVVDTIRAHRMTQRVTLQSFDWRTLVEAKKLEPALRTVALAQAPTIFPGTPWTAGVAVSSSTPFVEEVAADAKSIGASVLSPRYEDLTDSLIEAAHRRGLLVIPWTINVPALMGQAIDRGVDGIITDYPDRLRTVMAAKGLPLPPGFAAPFDVEAHRGGSKQRPENTLAAFSYALSKDVDTLELDTGMTKDGVLVVLHDRRINGSHCTGAFVGQLVEDLTLAQIKTLDCGSFHPSGVGVQRIPTLQEVFDLVRASGDTRVGFNIETKISPLVDDTAPFEVFTRALVDAIERNGLVDRAMIQSFDWRTTMLAERLNQKLDTVALVWQFAGADCDALDDECSLEAVVGNPSVASPWTNGVDWWRYLDLGRMVEAAKADVVSANWQVHDPHQGTVSSSDWYAKEDPAIYHGPLVAELQRRGLRVVPYTVNAEATMQRVIDLGVDGVISDDIELLQLVAKRNGLE